MIYDNKIMAFTPSEGQTLKEVCREYMAYSAGTPILTKWLRLFYDGRYYNAIDFKDYNDLYRHIIHLHVDGRCDDPTPDLSESVYAKRAAEYRTIFDSYRLVGFSTDQSFELLKMHIMSK